MLAYIDPYVGAVSTDQKTRHFNTICAIHAIATAAAGSTPVVNPVNTSGVKNTSYNCITVLSNTEAGGWTSGVSTTSTASTTYNGTYGNPYMVDLYKSTGKTSYPYYRCAFGNWNYPFSSNFGSYPHCSYRLGATTGNPSSVGFSSDTDWYGAANTYPSISSLESVTNYEAGAFRFDTQGDIIYVAATTNYLIISTPTYIVYFGIRDVAGWELTRSDNPPWVSFGYGRQYNEYYGLFSNIQHGTHLAAWSSGIKSDGTQIAPTKFGSRTDWSTGFCPISGWYNTYGYGTHKAGVGSPASSEWNSYCRIKLPLFYMNSNFGAYQGSEDGFPSDSPVTDPVTGLNVPPAYPIVFNTVKCNESNAATLGKAPGIYKGMYGNKATLDYFVTASEYTIGGETYVPIRTGARTYAPDLFFLRKA